MPPTPPTDRAWPRPSGPPRARASGCAPPTSDCAPPITRELEAGSGSSRCARASSSSWPASASSGWRASASSRPTAVATPTSRRPTPTTADADDVGTTRRRRRRPRRRHRRARGGARAVAERWAAEPPTDAPPSPGRLAQLRRRFHELGAANPYAVEEYAELKTRLETLETQGSDLRTAIAKTRELIAELDTMIADQFRTTFPALESARSSGASSSCSAAASPGCR